MRVLVCGGRDYADRELLEAFLDLFHIETPITLLIHGGAKGADSLAGEWAKKHGIPCSVYTADWDTHGRSAGPIRNARMLAEGAPDRVIAFPGGRGTDNMVMQATKANVPVRLVANGPYAAA